MIAYLFSFIWYIGCSYLVRDGCSAIIFVKHVKTVFIQVLNLCSVVHNAVRMHELLPCRESSHKCHHAAQTTPTWTKMILTCFMKFIAVHAIHGQIWMNNVPNGSTELCYHALKSVLYLFSILRNLESNPGFLKKKLTLYTLCHDKCTI